MSNDKENPRRNAPCFDRLCQRFDDIFRHQAQKREFRNYLCRLLGEMEPKNLLQMVAHIAILAGVVKFLPHPNPPRTRGEGVRNSQMMRGLL